MESKLSPRQKAEATAEKLKAKLEYQVPFWPHVLDVEALAPAGYRWACDEVHALVALAGKGETSRAWNDLAERMEAGLVRCPPDCNCGEGGVDGEDVVEIDDAWEADFRARHPDFGGSDEP